MAKKSLVIVESPAKAKTIGKYLGSNYEVKACMGHLRDLPKSKLGVDLEHDFEPDYKPIKGKEDIIGDLKKSAKKSEYVYLATDPDREGEAISWHLQNVLGLNPDAENRIEFNEVSAKAIERRWNIPARSIITSWTHSRRGGCWTDWWDISCPPCSTARSTTAILPRGAVSRAGGCSRWRSA